MDVRLMFAALREALVTLLAALATLACTLAIAAEPGPAILAVVLCLSLSRSQLDRDLRGRIEAAIALPIVSLAALGVAWLLHHLPLVGAAAFVVALSLSIWLRRFGPMGRKAGTLIALPFVTILVTPYAPPRHVSPALALAMPVIVALLALFWVSVMHAVAQRLGWMPAAPPSKTVERAATPNAGGMRPMASTRMAAQMGVALAAAFAVGHLFFEQHWAWVVLTAFIVNSGSQGRLDVAYKSGLRLLGAAAGTVMALLMSQGLGGHDAGTVALMLAALFMGLWLRPMGYGWWALFITLALALLQGFEGASPHALLAQRLLEILIGALIGVASAWWVWPVKSTDVLRRRMADALAALAEATDPARPERGPGPFLAGLAAVRKISPAFRAARWLRKPQAADWIDRLLACEAPAVALIERRETPRPVRKAVGLARLAMKTPEDIGPALAELLKELQTPPA